jgi:hypothetical protein
VSGSLPGTATVTNGSFSNELQQGMTLGSTISFKVDLTINAPTGGSLPDTISLFALIDPNQRPTGSDSLLTLQIDGSSAGKVATYSGSSPTLITVLN